MKQSIHRLYAYVLKDNSLTCRDLDALYAFRFSGTVRLGTDGSR